MNQTPKLAASPRQLANCVKKLARRALRYLTNINVIIHDENRDVRFHFLMDGKIERLIYPPVKLAEVSRGQAALMASATRGRVFLDVCG